MKVNYEKVKNEIEEFLNGDNCNNCQYENINITEQPCLDCWDYSHFKRRDNSNGKEKNSK